MFERKTNDDIALAGGIAQLIEIPLGGAKQWILIRGTSRKKPILLYLHGGPGMSLIGVSSQFFKELEEHFVVVNWDQRGSGLSADAGFPMGGDAVEQYVKDALELTKHLLKRFKREKIFLVGHSWGSAIGSLLIAQAPELFYAYLGAGQIAFMEQNEELEYQKLLELAEADNLPLLKKQLDELGAPPYENVERSIKLRADYTLRYRYSGRSQQEMHLNVIKAGIKSTEYNFFDTIRYLKSHLEAVKNLWGPLLDVNLFEKAILLELPVIYVLGRYDNVVLPELSEEYIEQVSAPYKRLIWFESGHSMQYEFPEHFQHTVVKEFEPFMPQ